MIRTSGFASSLFQRRCCCSNHHNNNNNRICTWVLPQQHQLHQQQRLFSSSSPLSLLLSPPPCLDIYQSVQEALEDGRPVVALESTIVAQGMPYPQNFELSRDLAQLLRDRGVEPATIAIHQGRCKIGLSNEELHDLAATAQNNNNKNVVEKCSTRELGLLLAQQQQQSSSYSSSSVSVADWGATTVASTMVLAHLAGISTFVTGGVGGVHRQGQETMDISADLQQLCRTPVIVVSAGIKSILDIPRTLEVLETNGVPVVTYQSDEFPAFFSPHSGIVTPCRMDEASTIASAFWYARKLQLSHGMLVAVPNPTPAQGQMVEQAIQMALQEANDHHLQGRDVTPFLLKRIAETTHGQSLQSNISLVKQNANVGAQIAIEIAKQKQQQQQSTVFVPSSYPTKRAVTNETTTTTITTPPNPKDNSSVEKETDQTSPKKQSKKQIVIMGGMVMDLVAKPSGKKLLLHTSNPATSTQSDGGVGRNIAEVLSRLSSSSTQHPISFYTAIGDDDRGHAMIQRLQQSNDNHDNDNNNHAIVQIEATIIPHLPTALYLAILTPHNGNLHTACADMQVLEHIPIPSVEVFQQASYLVVDANAPLSSLLLAVERATALGVTVVLEPTSAPKAMILGSHDEFLKHVTWATPNVEELCALVDGWPTQPDELDLVQHDILTIQELSRKLLLCMNPTEAHLIVTMGDQGVLYAHKKKESTTTVTAEGAPPSFSFQHFSVEERVHVMANATGAGDTLLGAFLYYHVQQGMDIPTAIQMGMKAAMESLKHASSAVAPSLSTWNRKKDKKQT